MSASDYHPEILLFYGWWQFAVCSFAFLALMSIWWHLGRKRNDQGQVWLAFSILCWSFSGLAEVIFVTQEESQNYLLEVIRSVFSLSNSLFILLALPWFKYLPEKIKGLIKSPYWPLIIGIPYIFCLLPTISKIWIPTSHSLIQELDVYYAFFTLAFLGSVLWTTFHKRRLALLAYLSLLCIGITLIAQVYKLADTSLNLTMFSAIFKTSLIMLFFALALSWVKELTEDIIPSFRKLGLHLYNSKSENNKIKAFAVLKGIPGIPSKEVELSPSNYNLLERFAEQRKSDLDGWLEIKPKDAIRGKATYDIKDHNEIKRLLQSLLDGLFGVKAWSKEQHYTPLKKALLELSDKRERKIRLRLRPEQISFKEPESPAI